MRPAAAAALMLACLVSASTADAQTAVRIKRRPQPLPAVPAPPPAPRPGVLRAPAAARSGGLATGGLASAGLRATGDGGAVCRAGCAHNRYACEVADDSCAPQWAACVRSCGDSGAGKSALLSRE